MIKENKQRYFLMENLPAEIKATVIQSQEASTIEGLVLPTRQDLSQGQAKTLLRKFNGAPQWSQGKARARGAIVEAFDLFSKESTDSMTETKSNFIRRYNSGNDGLGLSGETYTIIDAISRPTLDRWRSQKKQFGLCGLLETTRNRRSFTGLTEEMQHYIIGIKTRQISTRASRIYEYLVNKHEKPETSLPSEATVRRFLAHWQEENKSLVAYLKNPDQWRSEYQAAFGDSGEKAKHFLHMIEFDNTPADIMCADNKRYTITGAIDIYSRRAKCQVVPTAKSQAVANLIRSLILDWGLFDMAIMDNGQDYASMHIEAACGALGIGLDFLPPFTPEGKPHIERFFGTLARGLFEELSGYIGHSVADRKAIESRKSFARRMFDKNEVIDCSLGPDELQAVIDSWLDNIYHQRKHRGIDKTPVERAGESTRPVRRILDERVLDILLAPVGTPTVQKKGLRYQNGVYAAIDLARYIGEKVRIRRDMADAGKLYVFDMTSKFICIAKDNSLEGISVEDANIAKKKQRKQILEQARALKSLAKEVGDPMAELLEANRKGSGRLFPFGREEIFENEAMREASKAIVEPEPVETFTPDKQEIKAAKKIVRIHDDEPWFETGMERYKYLQRQEKIRLLTETETAWREGYKCTEEYYKVFVMPYE